MNAIAERASAILVNGTSISSVDLLKPLEHLAVGFERHRHWTVTDIHWAGNSMVLHSRDSKYVLIRSLVSLLTRD